ncbi:hypothetical protein L204_104863 [Cryptococcus depauperatus]|nr:hypothetical protein L204_05363 [Cryptococcus depauperatus CBS 7855]ODN92274.1 hypothetical protein L204_05373 [Cryptococcus depauperatus CBS 7855]
MTDPTAHFFTFFGNETPVHYSIDTCDDACFDFLLDGPAPPSAAANATIQGLQHTTSLRDKTSHTGTGSKFNCCSEQPSSPSRSTLAFASQAVLDPSNLLVALNSVAEVTAFEPKRSLNTPVPVASHNMIEPDFLTTINPFAVFGEACAASSDLDYSPFGLPRFSQPLDSLDLLDSSVLASTSTSTSTSIQAGTPNTAARPPTDTTSAPLTPVKSRRVLKTVSKTPSLRKKASSAKMTTPRKVAPNDTPKSHKKGYTRACASCLSCKAKGKKCNYEVFNHVCQGCMEDDLECAFSYSSKGYRKGLVLQQRFEAEHPDSVANRVTNADAQHPPLPFSLAAANGDEGRMQMGWRMLPDETECPPSPSPLPFLSSAYPSFSLPALSLPSVGLSPVSSSITTPECLDWDALFAGVDFAAMRANEPVSVVSNVGCEESGANRASRASRAMSRELPEREELLREYFPQYFESW